MGKYGYTQNPVEEKGGSLSIPSMPLNKGGRDRDKAPQDGAKQSLQNICNPCHHRELRDKHDLPQKKPSDEQSYDKIIQRQEWYPPSR